MPVVRDISAKLGLEADLGDFIKADLLFTNLHKGLEKLSEATLEFVKDLTRLVPEVAAEAKAIDTLAQKTGETTTAIQEWQYAAERSETSGETLAAGFNYLARRMQAAKEGSKEAAASFAGVGISITQANGKLRPTGDVLADIAEHFEATEDGAEKTAKAADLLGRSAGIDLIPMLNEGSAGIAKLRKEAHAMGKVLDDEAIKAGIELSETLEDLEHSAEGLKKQFAASLLPTVALLAERFKNWWKENQPLVRQLGEDLARAVDWFGKNIERLAMVAIPALLLAMGQATLAAYRFAAAWIVANLPLIATIAALIILGLILEDIWTSINGGEGLVYDLMESWNGFLSRWTKPNADDPWWLALLKEFLAFIGDIETSAKRVDQAFTILGERLSAMLTLLKEVAAIGLKVASFGLIDLTTGSVARTPAVPSIPATAPPGTGLVSGSTASMANTFNITQLPGEDSEAFARRVADIVSTHNDSMLQAAQGG